MTPFSERRFKLVAVDVDGTILASGGRVSEVNARAVAEAMAMGVQVVLVSGRPPYGMDYASERLGLRGYQIACNGALALDVRSGEVFYDRPLPDGDAAQAVMLAREHGLYLSYYAGPHWYVERECEEMRLEQAALGNAPVIVPDLLEADLPAPEKVLILSVADPEGLRRFYEEATLRLPDTNVHYSGVASVEIVHAQASKGAALAVLTEKLGLRPEQVMAIGDNFNDLSMMEFAGLAVAVGNAPPEVQAAADLVVAPCEGDGVAEAIELLILRPALNEQGGGER